MAGRLRPRERVGMNNKIVNHSHKRMMSGFCSIALIACFVLGGSTAFAQTSYKVTDLGVLPSKEESVPAAINGQGLVAGTSIAEASGEAAFLLACATGRLPACRIRSISPAASAQLCSPARCRTVVTNFILY